jgi:hypothetical protein
VIKWLTKMENSFVISFASSTIRRGKILGNIFILIEYIRKERAELKALRATILMQNDKGSPHVYSPNCPIPLKFSDFSPNQGSRRFFAPPLQMLILRLFQTFIKTVVFTLRRILCSSGWIGETVTRAID